MQRTTIRSSKSFENALKSPESLFASSLVNMRLIIATTLLFGPAFAAPKPESLPQGINFDVIDAVPEPEALGPEVDVTVETIPYDRESAVAAASFQVLATAVPVANKKRNTEADEVAPACETEEQPAGQGMYPPTYGTQSLTKFQSRTVNKRSRHLCRVS